MYQKISIFAVHYNLKGGLQTRRFVAAGIFYACAILIFGSVPPCMSIMDMLPLRCNATGKAEPSFISAYHNFNTSVMHYTEEQKVERVKNALFEGWQKLASINNEARTASVIQKSIYLINYQLLQLVCNYAPDTGINSELSTALFDLHCLYEIFESVDESLKNENQ